MCHQWQRWQLIITQTDDANRYKHENYYTETYWNVAIYFQQVQAHCSSSFTCWDKINAMCRLRIHAQNLTLVNCCVKFAIGLTTGSFTFRRNNSASKRYFHAEGSVSRQCANDMRTTLDNWPSMHLLYLTNNCVLWPPYGIGQAIIFLPCGFFLLSFFFLFLA